MDRLQNRCLFVHYFLFLPQVCGEQIAKTTHFWTWMWVGTLRSVRMENPGKSAEGVGNWYRTIPAGPRTFVLGSAPHDSSTKNTKAPAISRGSVHRTGRCLSNNLSITPPAAFGIALRQIDSPGKVNWN